MITSSLAISCPMTNRAVPDYLLQNIDEGIYTVAIFLDLERNKERKQQKEKQQQQQQQQRSTWSITERSLAS